jgi:methionine-gamma-lyase
VSDERSSARGSERLHIDTLAVHGAGRPDGADHVHAIHQTSTFDLESAEAGRLGFLRQPGGAAHIYTRLGNPTTEALERALAALEGRELDEPAEALAFSSGMAAITTTLLALAAGGTVIAQAALYGGTSEFLRSQAGGMGMTVVSIDLPDASALAGVLDAHPGARLLYLETPANPLLTLCDLQALAALGHERGLVVCADNTFATPLHQLPLTLGVDVVLHSTTKYLGGHGTVVGGAVVARPELIARIREWRKNLGGVPSPFDSWLVLGGLKTFPLRMRRHSESAQRVAEWLEDHPAVRRVHYPGLPAHPGHALARRQMREGFGGVVSFELRGAFAAARSLMEGVRLCTLAVSLGSPATLIQHPASMSHAVVDPEGRERTGISPGLVRLALGLEDAEDVLADLERALAAG